MTGLYDRKPGDMSVEPAADPLLPDHLHGHEHGAGHDGEHPVLWERWQKKRTFVRAIVSVERSEYRVLTVSAGATYGRMGRRPTRRPIPSDIFVTRGCRFSSVPRPTTAATMARDVHQGRARPV